MDQNKCKFRKSIAFIIMLLPLSVLADSTEVHPLITTPQQLQTSVSTSANDCGPPLKSTPYVIIAGIGGAHMDLSCPPERPIMYKWSQVVGFAGFLSVQAGGGESSITCCPVKREWVPAPRSETNEQN